MKEELEVIIRHAHDIMVVTKGQAHLKAMTIKSLAEKALATWEDEALEHSYNENRRDA